MATDYEAAIEIREAISEVVDELKTIGRYLKEIRESVDGLGLDIRDYGETILKQR